ncbi:MAG TPA: ATP-binding protein [Bacillota bacterium]|jgi:SpoVK/Ycf46/Vps4 family AAA+-type ATPase
MARADLLVNLTKAAARGDQVLFRKTLEAIVAEERRKQHNVLANQLSEYLSTPNGKNGLKSLAPDDRVQHLLYETMPKRALDDLVLPLDVKQSCMDIIEEYHRRDLLRSYGLEPRHRILLVGPPGNGKTSLAEAVAFQLGLPLYTVRYEGVIGSYLGETALRLRRLFDYAATMECVLFFDEFDTLGKERGDQDETGEIKRVVSSLLLQIDSLPSHVVVMTATNHPELLDKAVWRRFQAKLSLPKPTDEQIVSWLRSFEMKHDSFGHNLQALAKQLTGLSFSEIEDFAVGVLRRKILSMPSSNTRRIVDEQLMLLRAQYVPEEQ